MIKAHVSAYTPTPSAVVRVPAVMRLGAFPNRRVVPTSPATAAASAGPQPPIQTATAIAPNSVAYGKSDFNQGNRNQRNTTAAAAMANAAVYLTATRLASLGRPAEASSPRRKVSKR